MGIGVKSEYTPMLSKIISDAKTITSVYSMRVDYVCDMGALYVNNFFYSNDVLRGDYFTVFEIKKGVYAIKLDLNKFTLSNKAVESVIRGIGITISNRGGVDELDREKILSNMKWCFRYIGVTSDTDYIEMIKIDFNDSCVYNYDYRKLKYVVSGVSIKSSSIWDKANDVLEGSLCIGVGGAVFKRGGGVWRELK